MKSLTSVKAHLFALPISQILSKFTIRVANYISHSFYNFWLYKNAPNKNGYLNRRTILVHCFSVINNGL